MRVEYRFELSALETPRFSVEAVEGIGKLFTLATLVLNVLETRREVDLVFHGLNPDDPQRKITAFLEILEGSPHTPPFEVERGRGGQVRGASSYFQWVTFRRKTGDVRREVE